jgi:hypothetical protein
MQLRLNQARQTIIAASAEAKEMESYRAAYQAAMERGLIAAASQENDMRFRYRTLIESLRERQLLTDFSYLIQPQKINAALSSDDFDLREYGMNMRFTMPHEGRLFSFLNALQNEPDALFVLKHCAIGRDDNGLSAECVGNWTTLTRKEKT